MLGKKEKYNFYQKDEWSTMLFRRPLIKRKKEYAMNFKINEIRLRNRSTKDKIKSSNMFSFRHVFVCLTKCKKTCRMENFKCRAIPTSIKGLNCDQIDDYLYASQRLTNQLIKKYDLINKLKELNVGLIVNCEEEGEHPYCGTVYEDGLDENGFAYSTKELEKNGIHVLFCGWLDFVAPDSFNHMIQIVKKMYNCTHFLKKKVIVHCHAGMGRTSTSLACYKIFAEKLSAENARKEVRKGTRKMCLGEGIQYSYVQEFEKFIKISRENFFKKNKKDITIFKINEKALDVGNYKFKYFNDNNYIDKVPIFLLYIFDRIIQIKNEKKIDDKNMNILLSSKEISNDELDKIEDLIKEINNYNWESINKIEDINILSKLLFKWLNNSINYVINPSDISMINNNDYSSSLAELKSSTKEILNCIIKFLNLIKDNKAEENNAFKEFIDNFIPCLLGYSSDKNKYNNNMEENIVKLKKLIEFINKKK